MINILNNMNKNPLFSLRHLLLCHEADSWRREYWIQATGYPGCCSTECCTCQPDRIDHDLCHHQGLQVHPSQRGWDPGSFWSPVSTWWITAARIHHHPSLCAIVEARWSHSSCLFREWRNRYCILCLSVCFLPRFQFVIRPILAL